MKTLLCLLSQQHVPNLLSVHHFQPERLVLVESAGMREKNASRDFLEALRLGGRVYDDHHRDVLPLDDENSPDAMRRCLEVVAKPGPDAEWTVNLTGGTKPMSIAAYDFFRDKPARLVYTPVNRPNQFLDFRSGQAEQCDYRPSVQEFLAGYGFRLRASLEKVAEEENRVRFLPSTAQLIARRFVDRPLLWFSDRWGDDDRRQWWNEATRRGVQLAPGDVEILDDQVRQAVCSAFPLQAEGNSLVGWLNKIGGRFLTGGWLEVFVWDLLVRHATKLGLWDVHLGIEVCPRELSVPNELDVSFMYNSSLCWIECKTGSQGHDPRADVLYKVEAVTRQFQALLARAVLVTTSDNVLEKSREGKPVVKRHLAQRAELYRCRVVAQEQIRRLAEAPDDAEAVRQVFFAKGE